MTPSYGIYSALRSKSGILVHAYRNGGALSLEGTGAGSVTAVPLARGVPGCDEAQDGVVQPLSDSSAALRSTQSSAVANQGQEPATSSHVRVGVGSMDAGVLLITHQTRDVRYVKRFNLR